MVARGNWADSLQCFCQKTAGECSRPRGTKRFRRCAGCLILTLRREWIDDIESVKTFLNDQSLFSVIHTSTRWDDLATKSQLDGACISFQRQSSTNGLMTMGALLDAVVQAPTCVHACSGDFQ